MGSGRRLGSGKGFGGERGLGGGRGLSGGRTAVSRIVRPGVVLAAEAGRPILPNFPIPLFCLMTCL